MDEKAWAIEFDRVTYSVLGGSLFIWSKVSELSHFAITVKI